MKLQERQPNTIGWTALVIGWKYPWMPFSIGLVDMSLVVVTSCMLLTTQTVLFFHLVFVLLSIGAFFWPFRSFALRVLFWVSLTSGSVLHAVYSGTTQPDELIEIPLLTLILLMVFLIAQHRART